VIRGIWVAVLVAAAAVPAVADPKVDPCACSPVRPGFFKRDTLLGDMGVRDDLHDDGITIAGTYASEFFVAPGLDKKAVFAGLAVLAVDVDLATLIHKGFGAMHVSGLGIHGDGLSAELMDIYGVSNNVAPNDVRLFEAWLEQPIELTETAKLTVRAGLLSADQEFVLAKHSNALMNATFGIISLLSVDVAGPVYPVATVGASMRYETKPFTMRAAIYDGDLRNDHGIPTAIGDHALAIAEAELFGAFKVGAWHHTAKGTGLYAIVSKQLDRYLGAFVRASTSPDTQVSTYIDTGIRIGPGPLREKDFASFGLAFAQSEIVGAQTALEATYQLQAFGWLIVQPDVQLLLQRERTAGIFATRVTIAF
jgi:carbohydrate-selective porin OprB